ncbi:hypothetical protein [Parabacteroides distasonis]|uniref:hypothetical protein n=2 Tax=Bacteroidales TaxID=171549 RepID=UPI0012B17F88|nr:hypothetical protein [Parabacteroides distasonis]MRZ39090.1 hypothetical protein [Parabacteroides distasonis]
MCFGNKLNQKRPEHCITPFPTPNNFCGGFALNAVLVDLGSGTCPIEVYMRIQDYQNKEIIEPYPESEASKYLQDNKSSGTLMSLPSGICAAFKDYVTDRTVTVCYGSNFESGPLKNLISEEISRITDKRLGMKTQALDDLYPDWEYILVLVNNKHWIAVKHVKKDKFVCYDPDGGKDSDGSTMGEAIGNLRKEYKISGLYICI